MKTRKDVHGESVLVFDQDDLETMVEGKTYKMLQLMIDDEPKIIFGLTSSYHSQILEAYLSGAGISFMTEDLHATPMPGPAPLGEKYRLIGAGRAMKKEGKLRLSDESIGYRMSPSLSHGKEFLRILDGSLDLIVDGRIVQDETIAVSETDILEYKLQFLHGCLWVSDFGIADGYLTQLVEAAKPLKEEYQKAESIFPLYEKLKHLVKTKECFDDEYVIVLSQIRDMLLE